MCDRCNSERLAPLDSALARWPLISTCRSLAFVPSRRGKLVDAVPATSWQFVPNEADARRFELDVRAPAGTHAERLDVVRCLCKVALELIALKALPEAHRERWDELRAAALGGPIPASMVLSATLRPIQELQRSPRADVMCTEEDDPPGVLAVATVVGVHLQLSYGAAQHPLLPGGSTFVWRRDPLLQLMQGPDEISLRFHGLAKQATPLAAAPRSTTLSPPSAIDLPTHDPKTSIVAWPTEPLGRARPSGS